MTKVKFYGMQNVQKCEMVQQCNYITKKKNTDRYTWIAANVTPPKWQLFNLCGKLRVIIIHFQTFLTTFFLKGRGYEKSAGSVIGNENSGNKNM